MTDIVELFNDSSPSIENVRALESAISELNQVDLQTQTLLHAGLCARTIFIPAGTVLTGVLTNIGNVSVVNGDITFTTDAGARRITGFAVLPANAGLKRAGYAHADTWWTTIHHTELTDMREIEEEMTDEADNLQTRKLAVEFERRDALEGV